MQPCAGAAQRVGVSSVSPLLQPGDYRSPYEPPVPCSCSDALVGSGQHLNCYAGWRNTWALFRCSMLGIPSVAPRGTKRTAVVAESGRSYGSHATSEDILCLVDTCTSMHEMLTDQRSAADYENLNPHHDAPSA